MKYTYKERVRLVKRLKVFLAIFFAAITFFTGKVILDKTFATESNYGTATITFNSGANGHFEGNTTTNVVTYNIIKDTTRHSHTTNVTDDGVDWRLKADGTLIIGKTGETQQFDYRASRIWTSYSWRSYYTQIKTVTFEGTVKGNGSLAEMFRDDIYIQTADLTNPDVTNVTSLQGFFSGAASMGVLL